MASNLPSVDVDMDADPSYPSRVSGNPASRRSNGPPPSGTRRQGRQPQPPQQNARQGQMPSSDGRSQRSGRPTPSGAQINSRGSRSMDSGFPESNVVPSGSALSNELDPCVDAVPSSFSTSHDTIVSQRALADVAENVQKYVMKSLDCPSKSSSSSSSSQDSSRQPGSGSRQPGSGSSQPGSGSSQSRGGREGQGQDLVEVDPKVSVYLPEMTPELRDPYYDAVIISSEEDYETVHDFRDALMAGIRLYEKFQPQVALFDELGCEGRTKIGILEYALERCTYVFLYVTESFCKDTWAGFLSDSCLMEAINNREKQWCVVPIFTTSKRNSKFHIPVSLNSLKGVLHWCKDKFYLDTVKRLLQDKISVRRMKEEKQQHDRKLWIIHFEKERRIRQAQRAQEEARMRAAAEADIAAIPSASYSIPDFRSDPHSKSTFPSNLPSCHSYPSMADSSLPDPQSMNSGRPASQAQSMSGLAGGDLHGAVLVRSDSQSTTSLHSSSSLDHSDQSLRLGEDPCAGVSPFLSFQQSAGTSQAPSFSGPMTLPILISGQEGGRDGDSGSGERSTEAAGDLIEDSPSPLTGGGSARIPSGGDTGTPVDPPTRASSLHAASPRIPSPSSATGIPSQGIPPTQHASSQNSQHYSFPPSSFPLSSPRGSNPHSEPRNGPAVREVVHVVYHYYPPPAPSSEAPNIVYNISNAEVVQIGGNNVFRQSIGKEAEVCGDGDSSSSASLDTSVFEPELPEKPTPDSSKASPSATADVSVGNREVSVISADDVPSIESVGESEHIPLRQHPDPEETKASQLATALTARGPSEEVAMGEMSQPVSTAGPAALPPGGRGETDPSGGRLTPPGQSQPQPSQPAASPAEPARMAGQPATVDPGLPFPRRGVGQPVSSKKVATVKPMSILQQQPDSHHQTEVKVPADSTHTEPKAYHFMEDGRSTEPAASGTAEGTGDAKGEDGSRSPLAKATETVKFHLPSGETPMQTSKSSPPGGEDSLQVTPASPSSINCKGGDCVSHESDAITSVRCQEGKGSSAQRNPESSCAKTDGEPGRKENSQPRAKEDDQTYREEEAEPDKGSDSQTVTIPRGADPTLVGESEAGSRGIEWGPVYSGSSTQLSTSRRQAGARCHSGEPQEPRTRRSDSSPSFPVSTTRSSSRAVLDASSRARLQEARGERREDASTGRGTYPLGVGDRQSRVRASDLSKSVQDKDSKKECAVS